MFFAKFTKSLSLGFFSKIRIICLISFTAFCFSCDYSLGKDCSKAKEEAAICELSVYIVYPNCNQTETRTYYNNPSTSSTVNITTRNSICEFSRFMLLEACRDQKKKKCGE